MDERTAKNAVGMVHINQIVQPLLSTDPPVVGHVSQINTDWYCLATINDSGKATNPLMTND